MEAAIRIGLQFATQGLINHFLNGKNKKAKHYHKRLAVDATDKVRGKVYKFIVYASNIAFCQ